MVARYIPSIVVILVALAAYKLLGVGELFQELIKPKHLQPVYDYIIGIYTTLATNDKTAVLSQRLPHDAPTKANKQPHLHVRSRDFRLTQVSSTGRCGRRC